MKRIVLAAMAVVTALGATACGTNAAPTSSGEKSSSIASHSPGQHNREDVMFAQMMIPHHAQGVDMARLVPDRAESPDVKRLASHIGAAQQRQMDTMSGWLKSWGEKVPDADSAGMAGMDDGMVPQKDMAELEQASGADFDRMFLRKMIEHHQGAIKMAKNEQTSGKYLPAKSMAHKIVSGQSGEITTMRSLLKTLG